VTNFVTVELVTATLVTAQLITAQLIELPHGSLVTWAMNLDKHDWQGYFERLSRAVAESRTEVEVAGLPGGLTTTDAAWVALVAVRYDAERDLIEIGFEFADKTTEDYAISFPRAVAIDEDEEGVAAIEVTDCDGATHRVELKEPVEVA
jgi:hypothetical protein